MWSRRGESWLCARSQSRPPRPQPRHRRRRRLLGILTAALLTIPSTALALGPGADAAGVHVEGVLTVSESEDGKATGLEVLGQEVVATEGDGEDAMRTTRGTRTTRTRTSEGAKYFQLRIPTSGQ